MTSSFSEMGGILLLADMFKKTRKIPLIGITHDAKNLEVNFKAKSDN